MISAKLLLLRLPILLLLLFFFLNYQSCLAAIDNSTSSRRLPSPTSAKTTTSSLALPTTKQAAGSNTKNGLHRAISGGVSRAVAQAALYPLDALRTLSQTRDSRSLANVGLTSLVNGCFQTSSFALLTGASQFGIYGLCSTHYGCSALASSIYGAAGSCIFSVPQEVIKQRLITGVYTNFRSAIVQIWKTEGVRGYYSGWRPTMSRNVPFVIVTFTSRDILQSGMLRLKKRHRRRRNYSNDDASLLLSSSSSSTVLEEVGIGITSALIACVITQPIDVVKTRIMTQAASNAIPYTSALDCATSILRTEGWKRLYSGIGQRGLYMGGLWGITFGFEPILTKHLDERK